MSDTPGYVEQAVQAEIMFAEQLQRIFKLLSTAGYNVEWVGQDIVSLDFSSIELRVAKLRKAQAVRAPLSKRDRKIAHTAALNKLRGRYNGRPTAAK